MIKYTALLFLLTTLIAPIEAQQREGDRPSAENPFADKPRASAEGDRPRETEQPREGDRPRVSPEGERPASGNPFGDAPKEGLSNPFADKPVTENREGGFKPQTEREAELYGLVRELKGEIEALRREVARLRGNQNSQARQGDRPDVEERPLADNWRKSKAGGVFNTYDANKDGFVSLVEWLKLTNGNASDARRKLQTTRFFDAGAGSDEKLSPQEFIYWYTKRSAATSQPAREPGRDQAREGDRPPAEGDRPRVSPEADRPRVSPEGDQPRVSPEGDRPRVSPEGERRPANQLEVLFCQHDRNQDGVVSGQEFMALRGRLPSVQAQQYWVNFFKKFDADGNGAWSGQEFIRAAQAASKQPAGDATPKREGDRPANDGPRDGEGGQRTGPRDGDVPVKQGPRDGDGAPKPGPRDG